MKKRVRIMIYFNSLFLTFKDGTQMLLQKSNPDYEANYYLNIFAPDKSICYGRMQIEERNIKNHKLNILFCRRGE